MKTITLFIKLFLVLFITTNLFGGNLFISDQISSKSNTASSVKDLDSYYSEKQLGSFIEDGKTVFRLFTPNAVKVILYTFENYDDTEGKEFEMDRDEDAVWEAVLEGELNGIYYGYKVYHKEDMYPDENKPLCIDPYSKAVATYTDFMNPRKSIVFEEKYDWEGDKWIQRDWRDLVVYEMHVRDMTAHPSSEAEKPGTYSGLTEKGIRGGIDYIKKLGVNTVELLPAQEFGNMEIPFKDSLDGKFNTWNPYERNHWGYMTAAYFAPEAYFGMDWENFRRGEWMGTDGSQVRKFKDMVKAFHNEGIGVIMDVVYNHLSEYEIGNLKQIDKEYYFRLDKENNFIAISGCGNDLKTERPMVRRLIVENILFWMKEYHIDGFRFDLGKLIDWETIEEIIKEARKVNPNVVFVCEPWGGGYDPAGFSLRDWGSWNDQIRNGIKGENPFNGHGWIFGKWYGNNDIERIKSYVNGTLVRDKHGLFQRKEHSVNYLASHDGYTLGDFIRLGLGKVQKDEIIKDVNANALLTEKELKLNKLGALFLLTSQGMTMIHSGQEFARSKVIPADIEIPDKHKGMLDHNSYEKDNETNYINYDHADANSELFNYYQGLIKLRAEYPAFRRASYESIEFVEIPGNEFALGYKLTHNNNTFFVAFNSNPAKSAVFSLPEGEWDILVSPEKAGVESLGTLNGKVEVKSITGTVLKQK